MEGEQLSGDDELFGRKSPTNPFGVEGDAFTAEPFVVVDNAPKETPFEDDAQSSAFVSTEFVVMEPKDKYIESDDDGSEISHEGTQEEIYFLEDDGHTPQTPRDGAVEDVYDISITEARTFPSKTHPGSGKEHTEYHLQIHTLSNQDKPISVFKRFRQLLAFHNSIKHHFPDNSLPSFPTKTIITSKFSAHIIEKRKLAVEKYFRELLKASPHIFYSFHTKLFLGLYNLKQRVALVTGSSSGIGLETARVLASFGAHVIMACRSPEKTVPLIEKLRAETKNKSIEFIPLDLSSFASIREFVEIFHARDLPLHILINNAGVFGATQLTTDGFEPHMGVNFLGPFLLTCLLLEDIQASAPSRIVNVTASFHRRCNDLNISDTFMRAAPAENILEAFSASKLALLLFSNELALRLEGTGVCVNSVHPGFANTELLRNNPTYKMIKNFVSITPEEAAKNILYCALDENLHDVSGHYFESCKDEVPNPIAFNRGLMTRLWELTEKWTGLVDESEPFE